MDIGVSVQVSKDVLDGFVEHLLPSVAQGIGDVAMALRHSAAASAPVDTGGLVASVYVSGSDAVGVNTYDAARAGLESANPKVTALAEITPTGDPAAVVAVAAPYAGYVNNGTVHQSPQPFWDQAVLEVEVRFADQMLYALHEGL